MASTAVIRPTPKLSGIVYQICIPEAPNNCITVDRAVLLAEQGFVGADGTPTLNVLGQTVEDDDTNILFVPNIQNFEALQYIMEGYEIAFLYPQFIEPTKHQSFVGLIQSVDPVVFDKGKTFYTSLDSGEQVRPEVVDYICRLALLDYSVLEQIVNGANYLNTLHVINWSCIAVATQINILQRRMDNGTASVMDLLAYVNRLTGNVIDTTSPEAQDRIAKQQKKQDLETSRKREPRQVRIQLP